MRTSLRGWRRCRRLWSLIGTLRAPRLARSHGLLVGALVLALASHASHASANDAHAESDAVAVHVVVESPASCTNEEKFWAEVTSRTAELRRVPAAEGTPTLIVRAKQAGSAARGELELRTARGETLPPRSVVARTCKEVTAALALALVLAMEEGALKSAPEAPHEPEIRPPPPPPPPRRMKPPPPKPRATPPAQRVTTALGAHALLVGVEGLAAGASIFSEIRPPFLKRRLAFRLEGAAWRRSATREAGEADLVWLVMRARLCFTHALGLSLALCGLAEGGAFTGSATQARNPLSYSGPWVGAGGAVSAAWKPHPRIGIEIETGILAPFTRDDLVLRPSTLLYSTPTVVTWVGVGPLLHFD